VKTKTDLTEQIDAIKTKHRAMWALGDYPTVATEVIADLGPILVEARAFTGCMAPGRTVTRPSSAIEICPEAPPASSCSAVEGRGALVQRFALEPVIALVDVPLAAAAPRRSSPLQPLHGPIVNGGRR
jgi:hypothetical protein